MASPAAAFDLEKDLRLILFRRDGWSRPLVLSGKPLGQPAALTAEDQVIISDADAGGISGRHHHVHYVCDERLA